MRNNKNNYKEKDGYQFSKEMQIKTIFILFSYLLNSAHFNIACQIIDKKLKSLRTYNSTDIT